MGSAVDFVPPQQFDEYRLIRPLGKGGMGQVYLCHDTKLDRRVAVKFIRNLDADAETRKRFETEARAIARLEAHTNVVAVYRLGECAGRPYLVSQYIAGHSLDTLQKPVAWQEALRIGISLSRGLVAAHKQRVLHRDIKPANVMLTEEGEVKLLDFGLAKLLDSGSRAAALSASNHRPLSPNSLLSATRPALDVTADFGPQGKTGSPAPSPSSPSPTPVASLTATGNMMGTPMYMSPEAWRGEHATPQSDLYSLGAVLYELVAGVPPHDGASMQALQESVLNRDAESLDVRVPAANARFTAIVDRCIRREAAERFPSAEALCAELEQLASELSSSLVSPMRPMRLRHLVLPAATVIGVGVVLFLGIRLWQRPPAKILIAGGRFQMGSTLKEIEAATEWCNEEDKTGCAREPYEREQPLRDVMISSFRMDRLEVTQSDFVGWLNTRKQARLEDNRWVKEGDVVLANIYPSFRPSHGLSYDATRQRYKVLPGYERKPVAQVTWDGAQRYCESRGQRLPTEAEWEFAARGPQGRRFPWGNDEPRCDGVVLATFDGLPCAGQPVGPKDVGTSSQDTTPEGVRDLGGNVSEWVSDAFLERYPACHTAEACVNPEVKVAELGAVKGPIDRSFRGGNWRLVGAVTRAAARSRWEQGQSAGSIGFRCVSDVPK